MQLFALGLIRLNIDGTPMLGEDGQPIETYSNIDLASYSRAWTGLVATPKRGNNDADIGRVDPMQVSQCPSIHSIDNG
jgi:hypothetical protein